MKIFDFVKGIEARFWEFASVMAFLGDGVGHLRSTSLVS